ncbi:MAG: ribosomal protein L7/L12 [Elusimicrobia bacterium]|jgi:ribosomal protein L7/L12|nr:ribosomal protein L7/L12 [Elusimicrobiota bacterium]MBK8422298.1 ribosomal protein L7/L12 [Elusimicrobiota bacterium]MBK8651907.1 ribosomal protein L7/L12 [Elusimicrobiota bacterium]
MIPDKTQDLPAAALEALSRGQKIEAIKIVREARGLGLKESKDAVDQYLKTRPDLEQKFAELQAQAVGSFMRWALFLAVGIGAAFFFLR